MIIKKIAFIFLFFLPSFLPSFLSSFLPSLFVLFFVEWNVNIPNLNFFLSITISGKRLCNARDRLPL